MVLVHTISFKMFHFFKRLDYVKIVNVKNSRVTRVYTFVKVTFFQKKKK